VSCIETPCRFAVVSPHRRFDPALELLRRPCVNRIELEPTFYGIC